MAFGSVLEAAHDPVSARKERGAFFTPPELARFVVDWAVRSASDRVLEPACGEAEFLLAAADRFMQLGSSSDLTECLVGCELHEQTAIAARQRIEAFDFRCAIEVGDFLCKDICACFDAVIGNPPYVRFQDISSSQKRAIERVAIQSGVAISALSSLWMPFVLRSAFFLRPGGRVGMVLPAELLTVNYAAPLRTFLLAHFASVRLVTFDEPVFPEVQEEIVLLLADGWMKGSSSAIEWQQCSDLTDLLSNRFISFNPAGVDSRWSSLFAASEALESLQFLEQTGQFVPLGDWGRVALGAVTGKNDFFVVSDEDMERWNLKENDTSALCPPGSRHLRRLAYTKDDYRMACSQKKGTHLFCPDSPSSGAEKYIAYGESQGVHQTYKCRNRKPWWRVPVAPPPDAFVTYMNAYGPNICLNDANLVTLNSCHGFYFSKDVDDSLRDVFPIACLNSATMLGAELNGRAYGGGILKLEPREAARMPIPSPQVVMECANELRTLRPCVESLLSQRDFDEATGLVDSVIMMQMDRGKADCTQMKSSADLMRQRRKKRASAGKRRL